MRNLIQATLYPGIGAIEGSNVSVGRGTDTPFEQVGAPWIDGVALSDALNARALPGIRFYPVRFTPTSSKYANEACGGVFMIVTDRLALHPGARRRRDCRDAAEDVRRRVPSSTRPNGCSDCGKGLPAFAPAKIPPPIASSWAAGEAQWRSMRDKYLLYR